MQTGHRQVLGFQLKVLDAFTELATDVVPTGLGQGLSNPAQWLHHRAAPAQIAFQRQVEILVVGPGTVVGRQPQGTQQQQHVGTLLLAFQQNGFGVLKRVEIQCELPQWVVQ